MVGSPAVSQAHVLGAAGVISSAVTGTPTVTINAVNYPLSASGVSSVPVTGQPAMDQGHQLGASGVYSQAQVGSLQLILDHALVAVGLVSDALVGAPDLTTSSESPDLFAWLTLYCATSADLAGAAPSSASLKLTAATEAPC